MRSLFISLVIMLCMTALAFSFTPSGRAVPRQRAHRSNLNMEIFEGNPIGLKIWDMVWQLPIMKKSKQGVSPTSFGDAANVLKGNIMQQYGDEPSEDGAPIAEGEIDGLLEGSLFLGLQDYYNKVRCCCCMSLLSPFNFTFQYQPHPLSPSSVGSTNFCSVPNHSL